MMCFFSVSQPISFFKTSVESYMENLIDAYHGEDSTKPPQVQPATKKPKGIATSALEQNEGPGRGRGAGAGRFTPEVQEKKGGPAEAFIADRLRRCSHSGPEGAGKRAVAQVPLVFSLGNESACPTYRASARPLPPAWTCKSLCPSVAICPSFFPSSITRHMNAAALTVLQARQKPLQEGPSLIPAS